MTEVKRNWNIMLQDQVTTSLGCLLLILQFNPIMVALEMLQNSNPAHDYDSFLRLHDNLDASMAIIVERTAHHSGALTLCRILYKLQQCCIHFRWHR